MKMNVIEEVESYEYLRTILHSSFNGDFQYIKTVRTLGSKLRTSSKILR